MSYILARERDLDVGAAFSDYRRYLEGNKANFPRSAYELATADWYFNFNDHRCPHDAWLESATFHEAPVLGVEGLRSVALTLRLLGAYHDGHIEITYPNVQTYQLNMLHLGQGHGDWRYDEFRAAEGGRVIHEIEWATSGETGRWCVESSDVLYKWTPHDA
jgi:hypothetical protein